MSVTESNPEGTADQRTARMNVPRNRAVKFSRTSGQALLEAVITIPLLLTLVLNAINFGYFFLVLLNLNGAVRSGALYSIQGSDTPTGSALPAVSTSKTTVVSLVRGATGDPGDLASLASSTTATVQICSASVGITSGGLSQCVQYSGTTTPTYPSPQADPESSIFTANQVDVWYHFNPIIPGTGFNLVVLASPVCRLTGGSVSCDFHRQVVMRAMGG